MRFALQLPTLDTPKLGFLFKVFCTLLVASVICTASAKESRLHPLIPDSIRFDNDVLVEPFNWDRSYTIGLMFGWNGKRVEPLLRIIQPFEPRFLDFGELNEFQDSAYEVGFLAFTPDALEESEPVKNDRPYANLVYSHGERYRHDENESSGIGITIGLLGSNAGEILQAGAHRWWRDTFNEDEPVDPKGWDNQISDGGELTGKVDLSYSRRYVNWTTSWLDNTFYSDVSIGYQTLVNVGSVWRLGPALYDQPPHALRKMGNTSMGGQALHGLQLKRTDKFRWEFFAGARASYVFYDALMQGGLKSGNAFELGASDIKNKIFEAAAGFDLSFCKINLRFSGHFRTAEHKLPLKQNHAWGGLTLSYLQ